MKSRNNFLSLSLIYEYDTIFSYRGEKKKVKFHVTKSAWHGNNTLIECYTYDPPGTSPVGRLGTVTTKKLSVNTP